MTTRVVVASSLAAPAAPTAAELEAASDITREIDRDGLDVSRSDVTDDRTPWTSELAVKAPVGRQATVTLVGLRDTGERTLWDLAVFRAAGHLVIRRGPAPSAAFEPGQEVEVLRGQWGKRHVIDAPSSTVVRFSVVFWVTSDVDAVVA